MVTDFVASVASLGLNVTCIECSGPKMSEFASLDGSEALTEFANSVFDFVVGLVEGDFLQNTADRALHDARKKCPHSPDYDPDFTGFDYEPFVMSSESQEDSISFLVAFIIVVASLICCCVDCRFDNKAHRAAAPSEDGLHLFPRSKST